MSANLENSAVATGLEKVSFHSNPKERQILKDDAVKVLHSICQQILSAALTHTWPRLRCGGQRGHPPEPQPGAAAGERAHQVSQRMWHCLGRPASATRGGLEAAQPGAQVPTELWQGHMQFTCALPRGSLRFP